MENHKIFKMQFNSVYPMYVNKAQRKGRTKEEVDEIIFWLTGYDETALEEVLNSNVNFEDFFENAPKLNQYINLIKGVVCGVRVEEVENPLMQKIRYLDKLIDELAKGKKMDKIKRKP